MKNLVNLPEFGTLHLWHIQPRFVCWSILICKNIYYPLLRMKAMEVYYIISSALRSASVEVFDRTLNPRASIVYSEAITAASFQPRVCYRKY